MGYKHDFSSGAVEFIIPPPPGVVPGTIMPPSPPPAPPPVVKAAQEPGSIQNQVKDVVRQQAYQEVFDVRVFRCSCQRCPKVWITMQQTPPKTCPACKSPWWSERPSGYMNPELKEAMRGKKKKGKRRLKAGYTTRRGRPPLHAYEDMGGEGVPSGYVALPEEIPEVPVALLGTVDQSAFTPDQGYAGTANADEEDFPVPTPFDTPAPRPVTVEPVVYPQLPAGQPADVGGRPGPASEVLPPPALDPDLDGPPTTIDDDWDRFG